MTRWRIIATVLLLLAASLAGAVYWLAATRSGLDWAWNQIRSRVPVQAESVSGTLADGIDVRGLEVQTGNAAVVVRRASLRWRPAALLWGTLHVALKAEGVRVELAPGTEQQGETGGMSAVFLPLRIRVERLYVGDIRVRMPDGTAHVIDSVLLRGSAAGERIRIGRLAVEVPGARAVLDGRVGLGPDAPLDIDLRWRWDIPGGSAPLSGKGPITGRMARPRIRQSVQGAVEGRIEAQLQWWDAPLQWQATVEVTSANPDRLQTAWPDVPLSATLSSRGSPEGSTMELKGRFRQAQVGAWTVEGSGELDRSRWRIIRLRLAAEGSDATLTGSGSGSFDARGLDVDLAWTALRWPPAADTPEVVSPSGRAHLTGSPDDYAARLEAAVRYGELPEAQAKVEFRGDQAGALSELRAKWLGGQWNVDGKVHWAGGLEASARLRLDSVDPGRLLPRWSGTVGGTVSGEGRQTDGGWQASVAIQGIDGTLRGYPASLDGALRWHTDRLTVERLRLRSGGSTASLSGSLGDNWDLKWRLDSPQLTALLPALAGAVEASGRLTGPREAPRGTVKAEARHLRYGDYAVADLKADIAAGMGDVAWDVTLSAAGVETGVLPLTRLKLSGGGRMADHSVTLSIQSDRIDARLAAYGALRDGRWEGRLADGRIATAAAGIWRQSKPAFLTVGQTAELQPFCWRSGEAMLCLIGAGNSTSHWNGRLDVENLSMATFAPLLRDRGWEVTGEIGGYAEASQEGGSASLDVELAADSGSIGRPISNGRFHTRYSQFTVSAHTTERGLTAGTRLELTDGGYARIGFRLPGWAPGQPLSPDQPVRGSVNVRLADLGWVSSMRPDVYVPQGAAQADLDLSGTFREPSVRGELALRDGFVVLSPLGIRLHDLRLQAKSVPDAVAVLQGSARSGPGTIDVGGRISRAADGAWEVSLTVEGESFQAMRLPEARVLVSPDLSITIGSGRIAVRGTVRVPQARIDLGEFEGTVQPSPDVVIVGQQQSAEPSKWRTSVQVTVVLGEDIRVEGFGFSGRVAGELTVTEKTGRPPVGNGELRVEEGRFKAYGQQLTITEGRLVYANTPLDNPRLDFRAVRQVQEVTAGVAVTGDLRSPRLRLFSEPAMDETEALAYLVLGRPLSGANEEQAGLLQQAALSVGLSGGVRIAREIGQQFGIEEVRLAQEPGTADTSLVLGKYLSPRLYLQYAVGLWETVNTLRVRYELSDKWTLEIESGVESAADLLYTIER